MKVNGTLTCRLLTVVTMTFGNPEAATVAGASAATVIDFVIAATPTIARVADATAEYLRKSLRPSSGPSSLSPGMALQLRMVRPARNAHKGLSKKHEFLR